MTADDKYSLLNRENLTEPVRTQLSQKQNGFSEFFLQFLKCALNLEPHTPENVARYMSNKSRFKGTFDRQHGKRVQKVLRSGKQHC